ncbi:hypothetical protein CYCD_25680 [Tenuifilaceae bacterium CYCD]|nr:hypothetical protein CYCD_25680 [Tenuifilaceae bacterium CYCD]
MNHSKILILIAVSLSMMLIACSKDDETTDNIIKFDGGELKLYRGYQYKYSSALPETGSTPFVVTLIGEGVSLDQNTSSLSGIGSIITFYMYSESEAEIKQGDYTIDIFSTKPAFSADSCEILYNYDFAQDTGVIFNIKAGTFKVVNLGSIMEYDINVVADTVNYRGNHYVEGNVVVSDSIVIDNILFKGTFKGPVQTL